jgi:hypothetical protein
MGYLGKKGALVLVRAYYLRFGNAGPLRVFIGFLS